MNRAILMRSVVGAGALLAVAALPAAAEEIYPEEWDQLYDVITAAIPEDELSGVTGQNLRAAWDSIEVPTTEDLSEEQKVELEQLKTGEMKYVVEIPEEDREPGGPTHRVVTAQVGFGGLDGLIATLNGEGTPTGPQSHTAEIGDLNSIGDLNGGMMGFGNSALAGALGGFQPQ